MLAGALIFLVETIFGLFTIALLVRVYMQWARAPQRNAVSDFVNALTNFAVLPARRIVPGLWGLDFATLVLAWVVQVVQLLLVLGLSGYPLGADPG
ncbi:MAG: YggT family protein, partial [Burkholderiales bacterium]